MGILSGKLTQSAGMGGAPSAGAFSTSTLGMAAQSTGQGAFANIRTAPGDLRSGKITLAVVEAFVLLLVLFYIWTHAVQGGG
jgi:uncharacterized membrane protein YeaQ/YmgE (transglycosylase-associated protein family)